MSSRNWLSLEGSELAMRALRAMEWKSWGQSERM